MIPMVRLFLMVAFIGASAQVWGSSAPSASAPNCGSAEYRQLDFWLGDWDTFESSVSSAPIARARIDLIAAGCAVHELYEQSDGLVGDSILSFDPVRRLWQQTWVTNHGALMVLVGAFKEGALTLQGEVHLGSGKSVGQRVTWTAAKDGVREAAVMSNDGGKTWEPAFDVVFRKHR